MKSPNYTSLTLKFLSSKFYSFGLAFSISILTVLLTSTSIHAQFSFTAVPIDATCLQNGVINFSNNCTNPGAVIEYQAIRISTGESFTTMMSSLGGLKAGQYNVTATKTLNGTSTTATINGVIIQGLYTEIGFSLSKQNELCGNDGKITVTINPADAAKVNSIYLISGPVTPSLSNGNEFCGLIEGIYRIGVSHIGCPDIVTRDITIQKVNNHLELYRSSDDIINCNDVQILTSLGIPNGNDEIAYPVTIEYTISPPNGLPQINISTVINSGTLISQVIPFYDNDYHVNITATDNCGLQKVLSRPMQTMRVTGSRYALVCGGLYFKISPLNGIYPITVTFIDAPPGFNPSNYNGGNTGPFNSEPCYGGIGNPSIEGDYEVMIQDDCGRTALTQFSINYGSLSAIIQQRVDCTPDYGTLYLYTTTGKLNKIELVQSTPPNIDLTPFFDGNMSNIKVENLLAGDYSIYIEDDCGNDLTTNFTIIGLQENTNIIPSINCGSFDLFLDHQSNVQSTNNSAYERYYLQKYYPLTNEWGGIENLNTPFDNEIFNGTNGSFFREGVFRVLGTWPKYSINNDVCEISLIEFSINFNTQFTDAYAFQCANGNFDVYLEAVGAEPLAYCISERDRIPISPNINNGTNPLFTNLPTGLYQFLVKDNCNQIISRELDITQLSTPVIRPNNLCDGELGSLCIDDFSFLSYEWWKGGNSTQILSTLSCMDFPNYNSQTDAGTYHVRIYYTGANSCIDQTFSFTIPPNATAPNAGQGSNMNACLDGQAINLFDFLIPPYDNFGTWSELSSSGSLVGSNFISFGLSPGVYEFEYRVSGLCTGDDFTTVQVTLESPSIMCMAKNIVVTIDQSGFATIDPNELDNGSTVSCGSFSLSVNPSSFDCMSLGSQTVDLIVTTAGGSSVSCPADVFVSGGSICPAVPSLDSWGLICLFLLFNIFGIVFHKNFSYSIN